MSIDRELVAGLLGFNIEYGGKGARGNGEDLGRTSCTRARGNFFIG